MQLPRIDPSVFKDRNDNWVTQSLFVEWDQTENKDRAVFTTQRDDITKNGKKYLSFRKLYLACEDVTEDTFVERFTGGWRHWEKMQGNTLIKKLIDDCRTSLERQLKVKAFKSIVNQAEKGSYAAARFLMNGDWKPKADGRHRNAKKEDEKTRQEYMKVAEEADVVRLLKIV